MIPHIPSYPKIRLLSTWTLPSYPRLHLISMSLNPSSYLPSPQNDLEQSLHSLDVRQTLYFYLNRTKDFRQIIKLFISYQGPKNEQLVSSRRFSNESLRLLPWLVRPSTVTPQKPSLPLWPSSKVSTSKRSVEQQLVTHYRLDRRAQKDAAFGRAVLSSILA